MMTEIINCTHNVSLAIDCKMCEKDNAEYLKECRDRGIEPPLTKEQ